MKKIIFLLSFLFLMFSATVFAKWAVGTSYTTDGDFLTDFTTHDWENGSYIGIGVNVDGLGFSVVTIYNSRINSSDRNIVLVITDNEGEDINCRFHEDDIEDCGIRIIAGRSSVLTKMLYNGKSAKLMKDFETIATFDLRGIKEIMQKHVGSSYWYKYKLND